MSAPLNPATDAPQTPSADQGGQQPPPVEQQPATPPAAVPPAQDPATLPDWAQQQLTELRTQADTAQALGQRAAIAEGQLTRLTVARAIGLPDQLADRLRGSTEEELTADARRLAELLPPPAQTPAAPPQVRPVESLHPAGYGTPAEPVVDEPGAIGRLVFGK